MHVRYNLVIVTVVQEGAIVDSDFQLVHLQTFLNHGMISERLVINCQA